MTGQGDVWKPMIGSEVIRGWDTFAQNAETARKLIGALMVNEGCESLKRAWVADGARIQPVDDTLKAEA